MKIKIYAILITMIAIFTFASSSFLTKEEKIDTQLYNKIVNSHLDEISTFFKISLDDIIRKLNDNSIKIYSKNETIIQIALSNKKDSDEIIKILLSQ